MKEEGQKLRVIHLSSRVLVLFILWEASRVQER